MDKDLRDAFLRLLEEKLYEQVALEIAEKAIKPGLLGKSNAINIG